MKKTNIKLKLKNNDSNQLSALFKEYDLIQKKVDQNNNEMRHLITRLLIALLSIYAFCFQYYERVYLDIFIDFLLIDALPFVLYFICIDSIIKESKQLYYGQYLITLEKKINKSLCISNEREVHKALYWENWRIKYGFATNRIFMWDSILLLGGLSLTVIITGVIRVKYELDRSKNNNLAFSLIIFILLSIGFGVLVVYTWKKHNDIDKKNIELLNDEDIKY